MASADIVKASCPTFKIPLILSSKALTLLKFQAHTLDQNGMSR